MSASGRVATAIKAMTSYWGGSTFRLYNNASSLVAVHMGELVIGGRSFEVEDGG